MAVILPNSIILHIPKTAGKWVRWALRDNDISFFQTSLDTTCDGILWHLNGMKSSHCLPKDNAFYRERSYRLCFVRRPAEWYKSYWCFRIVRGWRADSIFDRRTENEDFGIFIDNVVREYPCGFLRDVYGAYADECTHIGKVETIERDLTLFMKEIEGVDIDCSKTARINTTPSEVKERAIYRPGQVEQIRAIERDVIDMFYSG